MEETHTIDCCNLITRRSYNPINSLLFSSDDEPVRLIQDISLKERPNSNTIGFLGVMKSLKDSHYDNHNNAAIMHNIIWSIWQISYWLLQQINTNNMLPFVSSYGEWHCTTHFNSCDMDNDNWKHFFIVMDNKLWLLYNPLQNKMGNNDRYLFYADIGNIVNGAMAPLQHDGEVLA